MEFCFSNSDDKRHIPHGSPFSSDIVPTKDSERYTFLPNLSERNNYPILFCGPTGTGKSMYLNRYLVSLDKNAWTPINITFSARTTANITQDLVDHPNPDPNPKEGVRATESRL